MASAPCVSHRSVHLCVTGVDRCCAAHVESFGLTRYGWNFSVIFYGIIPSNPLVHLRKIRKSGITQMRLNPAKPVPDKLSLATCHIEIQHQSNDGQACLSFSRGKGNSCEQLLL